MTINCKGNLISLETPKVMGILNLTPDSFYDGGKYKDENQILKQTEKMLREGATFIDLGAYSSRPGAADISVTQELDRMLPVVQLLIKKFPEILLSIDTFRSEVARESVREGAALINDISAGNLDPQMMPTVGALKVPYIMMHMRGNPKTMQVENKYENLFQEILLYFSEKLNLAYKSGINDVLIDPGFGFSKDLSQNYELLNNLESFLVMELPLLIGVSRKSMIYKLLEINVFDSLNGTTTLNTISLLKGANILRVHDVKEAVECVKIVQKLKKGSSDGLF